MSLKFFLISLFSFGLLSSALAAQGLSIVQDEFGLLCEPASNGSEKNISDKRVYFFDRKDTFIEVRDGNGKILETAKTLHFLETGVVFKSENSKTQRIFHLLENQTQILIEGTAEDFAESECDDTGNSKLCRKGKETQLIWTPEKIHLGLQPATEANKVFRYGIFASDASYFYASKNKSETAEITALVDYGAKFVVIKGKKTDLDCKYTKSTSGN